MALLYEWRGRHTYCTVCRVGPSPPGRCTYASKAYTLSQEDLGYKTVPIDCEMAMVCLVAPVRRPYADVC